MEIVILITENAKYSKSCPKYMEHRHLLKKFKLKNKIKPNKTDFSYVQICFKRRNKADEKILATLSH